MTQKTLYTIIRSYGLTISKDYNEYRVNFKNGEEATAYYTDDKEDALNTAKRMASGIMTINVQQLDPVQRILVEGRAIANMKKELHTQLRNLLEGTTK
jgi:hypothetical protein